MTRLRFLLRTCWHFRWPNLATLLGIAIGAAVFAGSLLVGDSVRQSLRQIVDDRLGDVDHLMVCPHFFPQSLAERLTRLDSFKASFARAEALIATTGNCTEAATGRRAPRVHVFGRAGIRPGDCIVSPPLAEAIGAVEGKTLIVRMAPTGGTTSEAPFDRRGDDLASLRLTVSRVAGKTEMEGAFSFYGSQRPVRNVWASLSDVQAAFGASDSANLLLVAAKEGHKDRKGSEDLQEILKSAASLGDYGLRIADVGDGRLSLESESIFLNRSVEQAVAKLPGNRVDVLAYLANTVKDVRTDREMPYAMAAGISALPDGPIRSDEIVLNQWAADDLKATPGDEIEMAYFVRGPDGLSAEKRAQFKLGRVIETKGIGADGTLVPRFKGVTDAGEMGKWDPPPDFEFHPERIRKIDEDYWKRYRAAPKALLDIGAAQRLWGTRLGGLTSIWLSGVSRSELEKTLLRELSPESMGLVFRPIRFEQLQSAGGNTDFGQLFTGFSFFLIISAALLVVLLLRLSIEQRSRQIGIMLAQGFTGSVVKRLLLCEGLIVLAVGCAVGIAASVAYAWLMMIGLRTLWRDAVGTTLLTLHLSGQTLAVGFFAGFLIGAVAIWRGLSSFRGDRIVELIAGRRTDEGSRPARRAAILLPSVLFLVAVALIVAAAVSDRINTAAAFFVAGSCALVALLLGLRAAMARRYGARLRKRGVMSAAGFAIRNAARNRGRSMLTASVLASAYFILFAVGSMKSTESSVPTDKHGSTGGYELIAEFDIPLPYHIGTERGRRYLGMKSPDDGLWGRVEIVAMRSSSGEDVSCRNLYRPSTPKILSVPDEMIADGAFAFGSAARKMKNPWELLNEAVDGGIPVIADADTAQWILHKKLGDTIPISDEAGRDRRLRIVGLLAKSMFQAEVLMGDADFRSLFPSRSGCQTLLIKASPDDAEAVGKIILRDLSDFGATVETTRARLASFFRIANSYISAFEMLGGLGILLGSFGFVVVLVRGLIERRNEFALLSALGFRRGSVEYLVLAESVFLLLSGVLIGVFSAVLATLPQTVKNSRPPGPIALLAAIATIVVSLSVFVVLASCIIRRIAPSSLRRE